MLGSMSPRTSRYQPLEDKEEFFNDSANSELSDSSQEAQKCLLVLTTKNILIGVFFAVLITVAGFFLGHYSSRPLDRPVALRGKYQTQPRALKLSQDLRLHRVSAVEKSFRYNRTFADPPSAATNAAWGTLFPPHAGFFHDAKLAPQGGSLAAYHQLHCLDGIRHSYWILYDAVVHGHNVSFEDLPDHHTVWHTRHCIDFLRQMLICNADLTIEHVDPERNGIVGFGVGHQCKRWEEVVQWTIDRQEKWKASQELDGGGKASRQ